MQCIVFANRENIYAQFQREFVDGKVLAFSQVFAQKRGIPRSQTEKNQPGRVGFWNIGGQGQNRTVDTRIFSPLLYRLSYLANAVAYYRVW